MKKRAVHEMNLYLRLYPYYRRFTKKVIESTSTCNAQMEYILMHNSKRVETCLAPQKLEVYGIAKRENVLGVLT